ncbi:MAG: response regulator [Elusimicrobia bacterium]|nr:response regulator [Elusimicrobiota bacterium]
METARVLVIEDDPDVRDTVCGALEMLWPGVNVTALADGREFLEIFDHRVRWDLVVLDLMLPDMSGVEICRRIRAQEWGREIPVLAMTGYDTPEREEEVRNAGASQYLAKPFEMADFIKVVKGLRGA